MSSFGGYDIPDGKSLVPVYFEGDVPEDFWGKSGYFEVVTINGEDYFVTDYPDNDGDGYANFVDDYMDAGFGGPGIILKPSQGHAGV